MDQTTNINQATPIKPQKTNLPLIITLVCLFVVIIVLIVVIIIINNQPISTSETSTEAEVEEVIANSDEPSKEKTTLDCTRSMSAEELAALEMEAVSGQIEIVADFNADDSLGLIAIYKTIIGPSTDAENPDALGDEFLVENTTNNGDELNSTNLPTYYLNENTTTKNAAKTSWANQGFTCLDQ